jgi:hypothetical protein
LEQLHKASRLVREPWVWQYDRGMVRLEVEIPPHAVAALTVELPASPPEEDNT